MRFRFLENHLVADSRIVPAGSVEEMPLDFVPTGACEAMDEEACSAVYRAGPQLPRVHITVDPPVTHWLFDPVTRKWALTGLGAGLPAKSM
jgi:hypothetical protein